MRVLHFNPINNLAGATRSMLTLMREMAKQQPTYAVVMHDNEVADVCREVGAEVRTFYGKQGMPRTRLQRMWKATRCVTKAIRDWDIDIVHSHSATGVRYVYPAARWTRRPIVCHARDNYSNNYFNRGLGWANRVVAISNWVRDGLPPEICQKTDVIYNAVAAPEQSECPSLHHDGPLVIGYAGRCVPEKGIDIFVDAIGELGGRDDFVVQIWGVPEAAELEYAGVIRAKIDALPAELRQRVHIEPFRRDIDNFYRAVDIAVVPSRYPEPMGRAAIEAMAWNRATVVANHGGLSEIVTPGQTGLCFEPGSAGSLGRELNSLLDDRDYMIQLADSGRAEVLQRFTAKAHLEAVMDVYNRLLS